MPTLIWNMSVLKPNFNVLSNAELILSLVPCLYHKQFVLVLLTHEYIHLRYIGNAIVTIALLVSRFIMGMGNLKVFDLKVEKKTETRLKRSYGMGLSVCLCLSRLYCSTCKTICPNEIKETSRNANSFRRLLGLPIQIDECPMLS
jgi:hypothetical protein